MIKENNKKGYCPKGKEPAKEPSSILTKSSRSRAHLSTFKGGNENLEVVAAKSSLESIDSKCSTSSSTNDDSNSSCTHKRPVVVTKQQGVSAPEGISLKSSYVTPQSVKNDWLAQSDSGRQSMHQMDSPEQTSQLVSMISLGNNVAKAHNQHLVFGSKPPRQPNNPKGNDSENGSLGSATIAPQVTPPEQPKPPFKFAGIAASLVGSIFFSLSFLCIKLLPDNSFQGRAMALTFRGGFIVVLCSITILFQKSTFRVGRDELWVNILRAIFGTLGVFASYCSIKYISLGDSTALIFSSPIWTSLLSRFILNEPLQWFQLVAMPLSFVGIILIAHPALIGVNVDQLSLVHRPAPLNLSSLLLPETTTDPQPSYSGANDLLETNSSMMAASILSIPKDAADPVYEERWPGVVIALAGSFVVSCTYIVLKFRKKTPIQTTTFWLGWAMLLFSLALMFAIGFGELPTTAFEIALYLGNGVASWLGQCTLQWAFLHEKANILSIVRTVDVAMTFVLSAIFLDDEIYWTSVLGAVIIGFVVASIMLNNWILDLDCMTERKANNDGDNDEVVRKNPSKKTPASVYKIDVKT